LTPEVHIISGGVVPRGGRSFLIVVFLRCSVGAERPHATPTVDVKDGRAA
jgi:hypothetical protein